jgi:hypothetical protein
MNTRAVPTRACPHASRYRAGRRDSTTRSQLCTLRGTPTQQAVMSSTHTMMAQVHRSPAAAIQLVLTNGIAVVDWMIARQQATPSTNQRAPKRLFRLMPTLTTGVTIPSLGGDPDNWNRDTVSIAHTVFKYKQLQSTRTADATPERYRAGALEQIGYVRDEARNCHPGCLTVASQYVKKNAASRTEDDSCGEVGPMTRNEDTRHREETPRPGHPICFSLTQSTLYPAPGALISVGPETRPSGRILFPDHLFPFHNGESNHVPNHTNRKVHGARLR